MKNTKSLFYLLTDALPFLMVLNILIIAEILYGILFLHKTNYLEVVIGAAITLTELLLLKIIHNYQKNVGG